MLKKKYVDAGWSFLELLLVITLLGVLFTLLPGIDGGSLKKLESQGEVQHLVDQLRLAQRRAILAGENQYLTLEPDLDGYRFYLLSTGQEQVIQEVWLQETDLVGINRTVSGMTQTFYFTPEGSPVFGCTITLQDRWNEWKVIIGVASGKVRIERL